MKTKIFFVFIISSLLFWPFLTHALINPSAAYCQQLGYEYKIVKDAKGNESGVCNFLTASSNCPAWDFFGGKCGAQFNYCISQGCLNVAGSAQYFGMPIALCDCQGKKITSWDLMKQNGHQPNLEDLDAKGQPAVVSNRFIPFYNSIISKWNRAAQVLPIEIVVLIDSSKTMQGSPATNVKNGVRFLVGKVNFKISKMGVAFFGDSAKIILPMANNGSNVLSAIEKLNPLDRTTNLADGLAKARAMFGKSGARKILIVISDGVVNNSTMGECPDSESYPIQKNKCTEDALTQASLVKRAGVAIHTVGFNFAKTETERPNAGAFAKSLLKNVASGTSSFHESKDLLDLQSILTKIIATF